MEMGYSYLYIMGYSTIRIDECMDACRKTVKVPKRTLLVNPNYSFAMVVMKLYNIQLHTFRSNRAENDCVGFCFLILKRKENTLYLKLMPVHLVE